MTSVPGRSGTCEIDCPFMTDYPSQTPLSEETLRVSFDGSLYKTDKDPSCFSRRRLSPEGAMREEGRPMDGTGRMEAAVSPWSSLKGRNVCLSRTLYPLVCVFGDHIAEWVLSSVLT